MKKKIVRHAKIKQVKKILPKKSIKKSSKWQFVVAAVALVTVGYLVFKNAVQKSDINMIAPNVFEPAPCGVSDLQLSVSCGDNLFKSAVITCADKSSITENTATSCRTAEVWYKEASVKCLNKCISSPSPLVSPSPSPSLIPSPSPSSPTSQETSNSIGIPPAPSGCYYQRVKCVRAPCEPVLVCEASTAPKTSPIATEKPNSL